MASGTENPLPSSDESYKPDRTSRIRLYASTAVLTIPSAIVARMASTIPEELTDFPRVPALNKGLRPWSCQYSTMGGAINRIRLDVLLTFRGHDQRWAWHIPR